MQFKYELFVCYIPSKVKGERSAKTNFKQAKLRISQGFLNKLAQHSEWPIVFKSLHPSMQEYVGSLAGCCSCLVDVARTAGGLCPYLCPWLPLTSQLKVGSSEVCLQMLVRIPCMMDSVIQLSPRSQSSKTRSFYNLLILLRERKIFSVKTWMFQTKKQAVYLYSFDQNLCRF